MANQSKLRSDSRNASKGTSKYIPKPFNAVAAVATQNELYEKGMAKKRFLQVRQEAMRADRERAAAQAKAVQRKFAKVPQAKPIPVVRLSFVTDVSAECSRAPRSLSDTDEEEDTSRKTSLYLEKMCEEIIQNVTQVANPNDLLSCCDHCHSTVKIPNCCNKKFKLLLELFTCVSADALSKESTELLADILELEPLCEVKVALGRSLVSTSQSSQVDVQEELFAAETAPYDVDQPFVAAFSAGSNIQQRIASAKTAAGTATAARKLIPPPHRRHPMIARLARPAAPCFNKSVAVQ